MAQESRKFRQDIVALLWLVGGLFIALSLASYSPNDPSFNSIGNTAKVQNWCGLVGSFSSDGLMQVLGLAAWILPIWVFYRSYLHFRSGQKTSLTWNGVWVVLIMIFLSGLIELYFPQAKLYSQHILAAGFVGGVLTKLTLPVLNFVGTQLFFWTVIATLLLLVLEKSLGDLIPKMPKSRLKVQLPKFRFQFRRKNFQETSSDYVPPAATASVSPQFVLGPATDVPIAAQKAQMDLLPQLEIAQYSPHRKSNFRPKSSQRIENWKLPQLSLIEDPPASRTKIEEKEIKRKAELLKEKLGHFQVTGEVVAARPGPAVTLFEFKPDADVKLSKITELADDLSLALSSESLRILAPIPGRDVVGIETSNTHRETVFLKEMLAQEAFWKPDLRLPLPLGKTVDGLPNLVDLRKLPHLMVAGTTGSGKSVFVVSLLISLLFKHSPKTLRLILIDPKQVDLASFENLPHLALPLVTDSRKAVMALKWAVREMEKRYRSMSKFGARGLETYNETVEKLTSEEKLNCEKENHDLENTPGKKGETFYFQALPYLVIVIEEFGDLMTVDKVNVEHSVVRLAQKARACGIHLVLAMQSPRKEVVTGLIKTNIPGRISFKVSSTMDSRIILDETGADRLLAQGDMLFRNPTGSSLIRHHGPFLKDQDVGKITDFWIQQGPPAYIEAAIQAVEDEADPFEGTASGDEPELDDKYDEILSWAAGMKEISASLIQRRFQLGYPRAARLIETFERQGVVGPANGSKPRQVLIQPLPASQ